MKTMLAEPQSERRVPVPARTPAEEPEGKTFYIVTTTAVVLTGLLSVASVGFMIYVYVLLTHP